MCVCAQFMVAEICSQTSEKLSEDWQRVSWHGKIWPAPPNKYQEHRFQQPQYFPISRLCEDQEQDTLSFIVEPVIMTLGPMIVDPVAVSSGFYPAIPDSVQPDFGNLHQDLLQPHLLRSSGDNKTAKSLSIIVKSKLFLCLWCTSFWHNKQHSVGG